MISPEAVRQLAQSEEKQCLTVYLNIGPNLSRNTFLARFRSLAKETTRLVPPGERKAFDAILDRAANHFGQLRSTANSVLALFTERNVQEFFSRVPVRDEMSWGAPNISQLLWLLEEYRPYGVLIVDQQKVRFLAVRLHEFEEFKEFSTDIDTSTWRRLSVGSWARGSSYQKGGSNQDSFSGKLMEHVRKFWKSLHKPLSELIERYHVRRLVVAGNKSLVPEFIATLPEKYAGSVVTSVNLDAFSSPTDAVNKIWPEIEAWEAKRSAGVMSELLNAAAVSNKAAVGIEPSLKHIQEGRAARLVVVKDYDAEIRQCAACQYVAGNSSAVCRNCSAHDIEKARLATALPKLVAKYGVPIEIIRGPAARELQESGGIGVFLRF
ncbi:MAG: VLRF1 family aeRF1-type release factor [candidate division WOR-3 bacterium]